MFLITSIRTNYFHILRKCWSDGQVAKNLVLSNQGLRSSGVEQSAAVNHVMVYVTADVSDRSPFRIRSGTDLFLSLSKTPFTLF